MSKYSVEIIYSSEDGCYLARCPEFRHILNMGGYVAFGDTWEEAAMELKLAIEGTIEILKQDGIGLPEPMVLN